MTSIDLRDGEKISVTTFDFLKFSKQLTERKVCENFQKSQKKVGPFISVILLIDIVANAADILFRGAIYDSRIVRVALVPVNAALLYFDHYFWPSASLHGVAAGDCAVGLFGLFASPVLLIHRARAQKDFATC